MTCYKPNHTVIIYVVKRRESRTGLGERVKWRKCERVRNRHHHFEKMVSEDSWQIVCESRMLVNLVNLFFFVVPKLILFFSDVPIGFVHQNEARTFSPCQIHGSLLLKLSVSTGRHARTALCCSHCVDFPLCCTLEDNSQHYKITLCIHSSTQ